MAKNPSIRRRAVLGIAAAPPLLFALVVVLPRVVSPAFAFAPPPPAVVGGGVSRRFGHPPPRLGYGPRVDDGGDQDPPSSAAPPACATGHDLLRDRGATTSRGDDDDDDDPTTDDAGCTVEDEDCLAFSSLGNDRSSSSSSSYDDDDVCDPVDVDCRSFLPPSSDDGDGASWSTTATATTASRLLAAELASRSAIVDAERIDRNWRTAHCPASFAPVPSSASSSGGGRVRGTSLDVYPIAACGTSTGGVCVIDLESNRVLGAVENAHRPGRGVPPAGGGGGMGASCEPRAVEHLYGGLDGGGTVSVAIRGDVVASSGREGGARLWRVVPRRRPRRGGGGGGATTGGGGAPSGELVPLCSLPGLGETIVTRLAFDPSSAGGLLWASCYDGTVRAWDVSRYCRGDPAASSAPPAEDDDDGIRTSRPPPPPSVSEPLFTSDFTDSVLDIHLCDELRLGVCATADGGAALFDMTDGQFFVGIMPFGAPGVSARSVLLVRRKNHMGYAVLCGGSDGTIHVLPLNVDPTTGRVDREDPFAGWASDGANDTAVRPKHVGPVMCMASPGDGRFVTGGQDGALRIWDLVEAAGDDDDDGGKGKIEAKCMYALTGYKLWLGSAWTDGRRLISDGGENSIVIRDFSRELPGTS